MSETAERNLSAKSVKIANERLYAEFPEFNNLSIEPANPEHQKYIKAWNKYYKEADSERASKNESIEKSVEENADLKDEAANSEFSDKPVGNHAQSCPENTGTPKVPKKPPPESDPCDDKVATCKPKALIHCPKGLGRIKDSKILEVVPDTTSSKVITLKANVQGGCGEQVEWTIKGLTNEVKAGNNQTLEVSPLVFRHLSVSPLGRWAMKAAPQEYRITPAIKCGSLSSPYTVRVYPGEQVNLKIAPSSWAFYSEIQDAVNSFCAWVFGENRLEILFPKGDITIEARWQEHSDYTAFYAYNIKLGLNPLFGITSRIGLVDALRSLSVPPRAVSWIRKYTGDLLYLALEGKISVNGHLARIAPENYSHWSASTKGEINIVLGAEIGKSKKVLAFEATGESGIALTLALDPRPQDPSNKVFKSDMEFSGLKSKIALKVAGGFFTFEEEYQIIAPKPLLSNHQLTIFD